MVFGFALILVWFLLSNNKSSELVKIALMTNEEKTQFATAKKVKENRFQKVSLFLLVVSLFGIFCLFASGR